MYLAQVLGLLPEDAYERANILTYYSSQRELLEKQSNISQKATPAERREALETLRKEGVPTHLKYHEVAVKGPYYFGDEVCGKSFCVLAGGRMNVCRLRFQIFR
jgi:hypothetical protein